jgi:MFS family permease
MRVARPGERWIVLAAAVGVMVVVGAAYSWSLFTRPLMAFYGWSSLQVAFVFSILMAFVGVGAVVGGILHDRFGPRRIALLGVACWSAGSVFGGLGLSRFGVVWLDVVYGAVGGLGCGILYIVPGATVTKWFPEERGLANGLTLCGFGFGALVFNLIVRAVPAFARVADAAHRVIMERNAAIVAGRPFALPASLERIDAGVIAHTFVWSGLAYLVIGGLCSLVLHPPPAGYSVPKAAAKLALERDVSPGEMLRTPAFYVIWVMLFINGTAGLALLCNAVPLYAEATHESGAAAIGAFGWISAANGGGRLLWAWLSDVLGRLPSLAVCFVLEAIALLAIPKTHDVVVVTVAFALVLLCFGGIFAIVPAVAADFYGTRFFGEDYSFLISAASAAGLAGPLLVAGLEDAFGSMTAWLAPVAAALACAALLTLVARKPNAPAAMAAATGT